MDPRLSKIEYYKVYNSLACVPFILRNKNTVVDLWNDTSIAGTIEDVDGYCLCFVFRKYFVFSIFSIFIFDFFKLLQFRFMNITMQNVVFIDQRGKMHPLDNFFVRARNVKYIHIPKEVTAQNTFVLLFIAFKREFSNCF